MIDYIILAVVVAALSFTIFRLIRRKQKGKSHCAGCSGCVSVSSCAAADVSRRR